MKIDVWKDAVWYRNSLVCNYCGVPFEWRGGRQIDHIVPRSFGGPDAGWNLIGACARCNQKKGDRSAFYLIWNLVTDRGLRYSGNHEWDGWQKRPELVPIPPSQQMVSDESWRRGLPALKARIQFAEAWYFAREATA